MLDTPPKTLNPNKPTDRRWLVSKKRTPVLADYVNKWRKSMLKVEAFTEGDRMIIDGDVDAWL